MKIKELIKNNVFLKLILITFVIFLFYISFNKPPINKIIDNGYQNWTKYVYQNVEIAKTKDWFTYNANYQIGKFSIGFPNDWKIERNVIKDSEGQKIGDFSPGLVKLEPKQSCFDSPWHNETGQSEFVSLNPIEIGTFKGKLLIEKAQAFGQFGDNKFIYSHFYCLQNNDYAFVINFLEKTLESENQELYEKILNTLEI